MPSADPGKPTPDELLRRIEQQESEERRGRLKIFLGYAPRVGKSRRMFDEGARRKRRGQDVVIAAIQSRGAEELSDKIAVLEVVGEGRLDAELLLKRRPQVCLVDELAVDNPPGSRHAQRWEDVEEIIAHGINVITAVNIQHIAELQDTVEKITGKRASNSVPRAFIAAAEEIEVVDAPEEELSLRTRFSRAQLSELRAAALVLAAEVIECQLERYLDMHGIRQTWGTQERILVCLTPRGNARVMLESGRRNADRFHGQLLAAYVTEARLDRADQEALDTHLDFARDLGAETHILEGNDPVETILRFAGQHRVTQIFAGHSRRRRWTPWSRNTVHRLLDEAEGMDVRIFPKTQSS